MVKLVKGDQSQVSVVAKARGRGLLARIVRGCRILAGFLFSFALRRCKIRLILAREGNLGQLFNSWTKSIHPSGIARICLLTTTLARDIVL